MRLAFRGALALGLIFLGAGLAGAEELVIEFENDSDQQVIELYIAEPGFIEEEPDILGGDALLPGEAIEIEVAPDSSFCLYDIGVVFDDGQGYLDEGVDLCANPYYLALGDTAGPAGAACDWEREGTEVGELFNALFGMVEATPEIEQIADLMSEALAAAMAGETDHACAIYADLRGELGGAEQMASAGDGASMAGGADDIETFIIGNAVFVMFHEVGHGLIDLFQIPVLGREEDAADSLASLLMISEEPDETMDALILAAADGWYLMHELDEAQGYDPAYWDEHGLGMQRFYAIICLLYGADPEGFEGVADDVELPEDRRATCPDEYARTGQSWAALLEPHMAAEGEYGGEIEVILDAPAAGQEEIAALVASSGIMEDIAVMIGESFLMPDGVRFVAASCGEPNAFWVPSETTAYLCYEMLDFYRELSMGGDEK